MYISVFQGETYSIFHCPKCPSMAQIDGMCCKQDRQGMEALRCMHSVVCQEVASDWRNIWNILDLDPTVESFTFLASPELKVKKLRHDDLFLCATQSAGVVSLLFTVSKRQKSPMCNQCSSPKCKCYRLYSKQRLDRKSGDHDCDRDDDWPSSDEEVEHQKVDHYEDNLALDDHCHRFGYNHELIQYPIHKNPEFQSLFLKRLQGEYDFPSKIVAEHISNLTCDKHGNEFDPDDNNLLEQSENIVVYTENCDVIHNIKTMARPTIGDCRCRQQPSGHSLLLWHVGNGKMIDYMVPYKYMHKWRSSGISMHALFQ